LLRATDGERLLPPVDLELTEDAEFEVRARVRPSMVRRRSPSDQPRPPFTRRFGPVWAAFVLLRNRAWRANVSKASFAASPPALVTFAVLAVAPVAPGFGEAAKLTDVARVYSLGMGDVRCPSPAGWDADFASSFGWAYTNLRGEFAVLGPLVCEGALDVGGTAVPAWQQALGALVLTHEAFHLRHWRFRRDEGKVECQAIAHFRDAAQRLGATAAQAEDLYPYALALRAYEIRLFPAYRDPTCVVPPWAPPTGRASNRKEDDLDVPRPVTKGADDEDLAIRSIPDLLHKSQRVGTV
jgi:hypothetical protein